MQTLLKGLFVWSMRVKVNSDLNLVAVMDPEEVKMISVTGMNTDYALRAAK